MPPVDGRLEPVDVDDVGGQGAGGLVSGELDLAGSGIAVQLGQDILAFPVVHSMLCVAVTVKVIGLMVL